MKYVSLFVKNIRLLHSCLSQEIQSWKRRITNYGEYGVSNLRITIGISGINTWFDIESEKEAINRVSKENWRDTIRWSISFWR